MSEILFKTKPKSSLQSSPQKAHVEYAVSYLNPRIWWNMNASHSLTACKLGKCKWKVLYFIAYLLSYSIPQQQNNLWDFVIPLPGNKKTVLLAFKCFHERYLPLIIFCDTRQLNKYHKLLQIFHKKMVVVFFFTFSSKVSRKTQFDAYCTCRNFSFRCCNPPGCNTVKCKKFRPRWSFNDTFAPR